MLQMADCSVNRTEADKRACLLK